MRRREDKAALQGPSKNQEESEGEEREIAAAGDAAKKCRDKTVEYVRGQGFGAITAESLLDLRAVFSDSAEVGEFTSVEDNSQLLRSNIDRCVNTWPAGRKLHTLNVVYNFLLEHLLAPCYSERGC